MSTIILGRLANPDRNAYLTTLDAEGPADPQKKWTEALSAVIPGEALAAYVAMISFFTVNDAAGNAASLDHESWVRGLTLVILLAIPLAYASTSGKLLGKAHFVRWLIAMIAFLAWLWLLPLSAWSLTTWDTIDTLDASVRAATGIVAAFVILAAANYLFRRLPAS